MSEIRRGKYEFLWRGIGVRTGYLSMYSILFFLVTEEMCRLFKI